VDKAGNVYVTGTSIGAGTLQDIVTIKYNSEVVEQWVKRFNGPRNYEDYATDLAMDVSGNIYITGRVFARDTSDMFLVLKYDDSGVEQWVTQFRGSWPALIVCDIGGNVVVMGGFYEQGSAGSDFLTVKYDTDGREEWEARFNGPVNYDDQPYAVTVDDSGNVYVTGATSALEGNYTDLATVKYNSAGVEQWAVFYNGPGNSWDSPAAIVVDNFGNVYVGGTVSASEFEPDRTDYVVIKYGRDGKQLWVNRYDGPGNQADFLSSLVIDQQANVYVTGGSPFNTSYDCTTIKYSSAGVLQWLARYNGPEKLGDGGTAIALDQKGNIFVTGNSESRGTGFDGVTIKYDSLGGEQWVDRYASPTNSNDMPTDIALDAFGNVYITGWSENAFSGDMINFDMITIKYSSTGSQEWLARYNGSNNSSDYAFSLFVDASGYAYVTGFSLDQDTNGDIVTIKYSPTGEQLWVARYDGPAHDFDRPQALTVDNQGNVYVTGQSPGTNADYTNSDYVTIKYRSDGTEDWIARYDGPAQRWDAAVAVALDNNNNVYVTGTSEKVVDEVYYLPDIVTIKYNRHGETVWVARYTENENNFEDPIALAIDTHNNVYVTGSIIDPETGTNFLTIKYDTHGKEEWATQFFTGDYPAAMALDGKNSLYVTGNTWSGTSWDFATVKYNSSGEQQWANIYGTADGYDTAEDLAVDGLGNVYIAGEGYNPASGRIFSTLSYDADGNMRWLAQYNSPENVPGIATDIAVDGWGTVYVTGRSGGGRFTGTGLMTTIKYTQEDYLNRPRTFNLSQKLSQSF